MTSPLWHVYLLECADGSLYCGISRDVADRLRRHNAGKGAKYVRSRRPARLLASRPTATRSEALKLEVAVKRVRRDRKLIRLLA